jgi:hypothetical protein
MTFEFSERGGHDFDVAAIDAAGQIDPSLAQWEWYVAPEYDAPPFGITDGPPVGSDGAPSPAEAPPASPASPPADSPPPRAPPPPPLTPGARVSPSAVDTGHSSARPEVAGSSSERESAHGTNPERASSAVAVAVVRRSARVNRRGVALIPLSCRSRAGARGCRGRLVLRKSGRLFGRASFLIKPGLRRTAAVRLNAGAMRVLVKRRTLAVRAVISGHRISPSANVVTLRLNRR